MQKVVGSSPIIRLKGSPASAGLFVPSLPWPITVGCFCQVSYQTGSADHMADRRRVEPMGVKWAPAGLEDRVSTASLRHLTPSATVSRIAKNVRQAKDALPLIELL